MMCDKQRPRLLEQIRVRDHREFRRRYGTHLCASGMYVPGLRRRAGERIFVQFVGGEGPIFAAEVKVVHAGVHGSGLEFLAMERPSYVLMDAILRHRRRAAERVERRGLGWLAELAPAA